MQILELILTLLACQQFTVSVVEPAVPVFTVSVVEAEIKPVTKPVSKTVNVMMSHSEMVALHNRLHGGGSWTWPGDLATHLRNVHSTEPSKTVTQTAVVNVSPLKDQPVRIQSSATNCPGGFCPLPERQSRRSRRR